MYVCMYVHIHVCVWFSALIPVDLRTCTCTLLVSIACMYCMYTSLTYLLLHVEQLAAAAMQWMSESGVCLVRRLQGLVDVIFQKYPCLRL